MKIGNRSRGHRSPLDKLPEAARSELARRCYSEQTLREIVEWLAKDHGIKSSDTSVSDWWRRRLAAGVDTRTVSAPGFTIEVSAPGAASITVRVSPSPLDHGGLGG